MNHESQHIEWKEQWRDEYLLWACGFANGDGGEGQSGTHVAIDRRKGR